MDELAYMNGDVQQPGPSVLKGTLGAFLGALLGAALWVIINQFGIIAAIAGYAIVYCACKGYLMLGKAIDLKGVLISTVVSVLILTAAHFLCWGIDIYKELGTIYEMTIIDAMLITPSIVFDPEIIVGFFRDYAIGLIFIAFGAYPYIRSAMRIKKAEDSGMYQDVTGQFRGEADDSIALDGDSYLDSYEEESYRDDENETV